MRDGERTNRPNGKAEAKTVREARLAEALRANLRRRKAPEAGRTTRPITPANRPAERDPEKP